MLKKLTNQLWALGINDESLFEVVKGIPGLRQSPRNRCVEGAIDSVAAAAKVLDLQLPPPSSFVGHPNSLLRSYQQEGAGWLLGTLRQNGGAILADEMGLGKTLQSIVAAAELVRGTDGRILVLGPAFLRENWVAELLKWGEENVVSLKPGTTKKIKADWEGAATAKWVISSYDLASRAIQAAFSRNPPRVLIMDEAHYLKGRETKRSKVLAQTAVLTPFKIALTGTPMWSRPRDYYMLFKILFGKRFGTQWEFDFRYSGGFINDYGGMDNRGATNTDELKLRLSYLQLRRLKSEVAQDLPELSRQVVWMDPTPQATAAYYQALTAQSHSVTQQALEATLEAKMEAACNAAAEAKQFLLFTYRKDHAGQMWEVLNRDLDTPCELITGDTPADSRVKKVNAAAANGHGVVATLDSMGAGVNCQSVASTGIFHALDYVPAKMAQGEARLHRMGQTRGVNWIYFAMRESMDELVIKTIVSKMDAHRAILGDGKEVRDAFGDGPAVASADDALKELYKEMSDE